jgi:hypothetical protein
MLSLKKVKITYELEGREYYIWWVAVVGNTMSCMTRAGFDGDQPVVSGWGSVIQYETALHSLILPEFQEEGNSNRQHVHNRIMRRYFC